MAIPHRQADPRNIAIRSRTFFITSSIASKRNLLQSHRSARLFIDVLYHYRSEGKFLLHKFVVMPDHFHALITVRSGLSVERAVQCIKGGFAFRAGRELGFKPPVWERGFSEVRVYESGAFERFGDYILANPVKRGLARNAMEFAFSSASGRFALDEMPQGLKPRS